MRRMLRNCIQDLRSYGVKSVERYGPANIYMLVDLEPWAFVEAFKEVWPSWEIARQVDYAYICFHDNLIRYKTFVDHDELDQIYKVLGIQNDFD